MKYSTLLIAFFISILILKIEAQNYGLDNTDPSVFTKYKIPNTNLKSLWFNTGLNFNSNKQDFKDSPNISSYYNSNFGYNLNPKYFLLKESEDRFFNISCDVYGSYRRNYTERHNSTAPYVSSDNYKTYYTIINLNFTNNNYENNSNLFYSLGSSISATLSDSKEESIYNSTSNYYNSNKTQDYSVLLGVGFGKIRNVTPVVSAIRFQERLKQLNLLDNNLSDETIENLAQQFSRYDYFSTAHARPNKYFWQSIDNELLKDVIKLNRLNMYASSYLMETLNEIRFLRQEGYRTGINLQLDYQNIYSANNNDHQLEEEFYTLGNAYINFSHQLNLCSQISINLSVSAGPNVLANPTIKQMYALNAGTGYKYELTDRIVTSLNDNFNIKFLNEIVQQKILTNNFTFSVNYFIEDNLSFNINYNWGYSIYKNYNIYNPTLNNGHSLNVEFTYYIDRGILIN